MSAFFGLLSRLNRQAPHKEQGQDLPPSTTRTISKIPDLRPSTIKRSKRLWKALKRGGFSGLYHACWGKDWLVSFQQATHEVTSRYSRLQEGSTIILSDEEKEKLHAIQNAFPRLTKMVQDVFEKDAEHKPFHTIENLEKMMNEQKDRILSGLEYVTCKNYLKFLKEGPYQTKLKALLKLNKTRVCTLAWQIQTASNQLGGIEGEKGEIVGIFFSKLEPQGKDEESSAFEKRQAERLKAVHTKVAKLDEYIQSATHIQTHYPQLLHISMLGEEGLPAEKLDLESSIKTLNAYRQILLGLSSCDHHAS